MVKVLQIITYPFKVLFNILHKLISHETETKQHHGRHVFCDYVDFYTQAQEGGEFVFNLMRKSLSITTAHEVHSHLEILEIDTPPGFTSVVLIDESHITAHCYSDRGLLAIDVFTCGSSDPYKMMQFIDKGIKEKYPNVRCLNMEQHNRFFYEN